MISFARSFKYLTPCILYFLALISFQGKGILCWLPVLFSFLVIPGIELLVKPSIQNLNDIEEDIAKQNKAYDFILYLTVIFQYALLWLFLKNISITDLSWIDLAGRILSMGLLCGTFGINVAHELGHRVNSFEQFLAKMLLLTSLYMHFFIEHNKGHHKHVATDHDPSTAKFNQSIYAFWVQTLKGTYKSAWNIAIAEAKKKNKKYASINNEMMLFQIIQLVFVLLVLFLFGWKVMLYFIAAALLGGLLLETVNYIEHYGLSRKKTSENSYERVQPHHSWNSNHIIGRLMLFELSRHSDHHYMASRKYQILRHMEGAPQMPTGYPGMIILSLIPPVWFHIMHKQMKIYHLIETQEHA